MVSELSESKYSYEETNYLNTTWTFMYVYANWA